MNSNMALTLIVLKIYGADMGGFRSMAVYVYSKEDSIKNEVLKTYKDIYLNDRRKARVTDYAYQGLWSEKSCFTGIKTDYYPTSE